MCHFIGNCRTPKSKTSGELCVDELKFSENLVMQQESFDGNEDT
jgi:hypothetical protein